MKGKTLDELHASVVAASERIAPHVLHTPLLQSLELQQLADSRVFIKLESEQTTASFKLRGAFNKLCLLKEDPATKDVSPITASSGNHGIACVHAMNKLGINGTIFVPNTVSSAKEQALQIRGAQFRKYSGDCVVGEKLARQTAQEENRVYISPYNDYDVMAGNGTVAVEILADQPDVDCVLVAVGGGGLIGGMAAYLKKEKPSCQIIGVQPMKSKVMYECVKKGEIIFEESYDTLSDGTAGGLEEESVTFEPCRDYVDDWLIVSEEDIKRGMKFMVDTHHKIVEGSAGLVIGGYMANAEKFRGKAVVLLSCGANISTEQLLSVIA